MVAYSRCRPECAETSARRLTFTNRWLSSPWPHQRYQAGDVALTLPPDAVVPLPAEAVALFAANKNRTRDGAKLVGSDRRKQALHLATQRSEHRRVAQSLRDEAQPFRIGTDPARRLYGVDHDRRTGKTPAPHERRRIDLTLGRFRPGRPKDSPFVPLRIEDDDAGKAAERERSGITPAELTIVELRLTEIALSDAGSLGSTAKLPRLEDALEGTIDKARSVRVARFAAAADDAAMTKLRTGYQEGRPFLDQHLAMLGVKAAEHRTARGRERDGRALDSTVRIVALPGNELLFHVGCGGG